MIKILLVFTCRAASASSKAGFAAESLPSAITLSAYCNISENQNIRIRHDVDIEVYYYCLSYIDLVYNGLCFVFDFLH